MSSRKSRLRSDEFSIHLSFDFFHLRSGAVFHLRIGDCPCEGDAHPLSVAGPQLRCPQLKSILSLGPMSV